MPMCEDVKIKKKDISLQLLVKLPITPRKDAVDQLGWLAGSVEALSVCDYDAWEGGGQCHRRSHAGGLDRLRGAGCNHQSLASK